MCFELAATPRLSASVALLPSLQRLRGYARAVGDIAECAYWLMVKTAFATSYALLGRAWAVFPVLPALRGRDYRLADSVACTHGFLPNGHSPAEFPTPRLPWAPLLRRTLQTFSLFSRPADFHSWRSYASAPRFSSSTLRIFAISARGITMAEISKAVLTPNFNSSISFTIREGGFPPRQVYRLAGYQTRTLITLQHNIRFRNYHLSNTTQPSSLRILEPLCTSFGGLPRSPETNSIHSTLRWHG